MNRYKELTTGDIEDIQFLIELQQELNTQDTDCQAAPIFWVLRDYEWIPGNEDYSPGVDSKMSRFHNDGDHCEFDDFDELLDFLNNHIIDSEEDEIGEELQEIIESQSFDELWEYTLNNLNDNGYFDEVHSYKMPKIVENTMFLTKEEAKRHIELNHYHYSKEVHTYAMTAWRAPRVEKLMKILSGFDFKTLTEGDSSE